MRIKNPYYAITVDNLLKNDTVVINGETCRFATLKDKPPFYSVIDVSANIGDRVTLSGEDTIFYIQDEDESKS